MNPFDYKEIFTKQIATMSDEELDDEIETIANCLSKVEDSVLYLKNDSYVPQRFEFLKDALNCFKAKIESSEYPCHLILEKNLRIACSTWKYFKAYFLMLFYKIEEDSINAKNLQKFPFFVRESLHRTSVFFHFLIKKLNNIGNLCKKTNEEQIEAFIKFLELEHHSLRTLVNEVSSIKKELTDCEIEIICLFWLSNTKEKVYNEKLLEKMVELFNTRFYPNIKRESNV